MKKNICVQIVYNLVLLFIIYKYRYPQFRWYSQPNMFLFPYAKCLCVLLCGKYIIALVIIAFMSCDYAGAKIQTH